MQLLTFKRANIKAKAELGRMWRMAAGIAIRRALQAGADGQMAAGRIMARRRPW